MVPTAADLPRSRGAKCTARFAPLGAKKFLEKRIVINISLRRSDGHGSFIVRVFKIFHRGVEVC